MNKRKLLMVLILLLIGAGFFVGKKYHFNLWQLYRASSSKDVYQCSMHPQIIQDHPGNCPICGMTLVKIEQKQGDGVSANPGERKILFYRHPMRPDVTSTVPAKDEMGMDYIPVYNDDMSVVTSSVPGHAGFSLSNDRQQMIGVTTEKIEKKDLSIEIRTVGKVAYDPELYNAMAEYREAIKARNRIKESPLPEAHERAESLVRSSVMRLRLMGISDQQINEAAFDSGDSINLLLPGKKAWVYAQVYEYEVDLLKPGQKVIVTAPSLPGESYEGKVVAIDSILDSATRTVRVRSEISATQLKMRPEMFVNVKIYVPFGKKLAIPESAVLDTGESQIAFVKKGDGVFEPRAIQHGREAGGYYEVLSGVSEGEEVVTSANFLIDSESRFRSAVSEFSKKSKQ